MATNEYGLDVDYLSKRIKRMLRDIERYTPEEAYNELSGMAEVVRPKEIESLRAKLAEVEKKLKEHEQRVGELTSAGICKMNVEQAEIEQLKAERDVAIWLLAELCVDVYHNGTGWDDWD